MVAVITGENLGISTGSLTTTGSDGSANLGRSREQIYVNATTGNLVVRGQDEYLKTLGIDTNLIRTYNSRGKFVDDNGDNWQLSV
ncbi:MAG: hypothetical protein OEY58_22095, partial [Gammaproteobacteria bacterium]|nr:hypothetical protein [Gammaproteobacteria bacterium]